MSAQSLVDQGYYGYAGWGDAEADADFQATGGQGKGGASGGGGGGEGGGGETKTPQELAQEYADSIIKAQKETIERETKWLEGYTKDNPFAFDEELARQSATAEYEPYYTEILEDYLGNMEKKRETLQSDVDLLKTLREYDTGARTRAYQMAVAGAEEGYTGQGMFFSGLRKRGVGQRTVEYKQGLEEQGERYGHQADDYARQKQLYDVEEEQKRRDVFGGDESLGGLAKYGDRGGEYQTALEGGILQRGREAKTQYNVPLEQSYYRQFPSSSGGMLKGYTIPDYASY